MSDLISLSTWDPIKFSIFLSKNSHKTSQFYDQLKLFTRADSALEAIYFTTVEFHLYEVEAGL